eukprot:GDKK01061606.1.p2 GENE.GDKK01061606.1~~GDKK01061606.1.p2  ORF type:complete len:131 (+),score=10.60 GDKK01061606.1:545-937(+)
MESKQVSNAHTCIELPKGLLCWRCPGEHLGTPVVGCDALLGKLSQACLQTFKKTGNLHLGTHLYDVSQLSNFVIKVSQQGLVVAENRPNDILAAASTGAWLSHPRELGIYKRLYRASIHHITANAASDRT